MRALALTAIFAASLTAQAPFAATYDTSRQISLQGSVTKIDWVNPRAFVSIDVRDATGNVTNWAVEIGNPLELERAGANRNTVRIGEVLSIAGNPARGQAKQVFATSVMRGNQRLFSAPPAAKQAKSQPAPRWPNGHVRLGPEPGKKGHWGAASVNGLSESKGTPIAMDKDGLLANLSDIDRVAPFQPWSRALYDFRQRNLLRDDPYVTKCIPPGGPRAFHTPNGFQFVEQPELGRVLVLFGGGDRNWRVIATDGRPVAQPEEVVLTYYGSSVGRWDGDTLIVDSVGYNERFWFSNGGLPHTEALHLVERFTRTDMNTLRYEVTVDDPRTYTRSWAGGWTIQWVADRDMEEFFCEENAESTFRR